MSQYDLILDKLAHDLRTPLTALKLATSLLAIQRNKNADADEAALIQSLQRNVARLEEVVKGLLTSTDGAVSLTEQEGMVGK